MDDDTTLVRRAARGDERAFRALVDRHYDPCLRYAARMLGDREEAEDAVQDTFIRVYRGLPSYRDQGRFRGWVFSILVNRCRSAIRRRSVREARIAEGGDSVLGAREPAEVAPFRMRAAEAALATLPDALREAFLLKCVEEWTYDEMAEWTGASRSALKMRVSRARDALRRRLEEGEKDA